jgi:hypothetical protein
MRESVGAGRGQVDGVVRARRLMMEGAISRALKALDGETLAGTDAVVKDELRRLHPSVDGELGRVEDVGEVLELEVDERVERGPLEALTRLELGSPVSDVRRALVRVEAERSGRRGELDDDHEKELWLTVVERSLKLGGRMAAPGPSGLRSEHVLEALQARAERQNLLVALATWCDVVCSGRIPAELRDCRLFAVPKTGGGVRPLGAGEFLRKLPARLALSAMQSRLRRQCETQRQYGMSRYGTQLVSRAVRRAHDAGHYVFALDIANAFNSIHRSAILDSLPDVPGRDFVRALYGVPAWQRLPGVGWAVECSRGVVQGCPMASALFALSVMKPVAAARDSVAERDVDVGGARSTTTDYWYADAGYIVSSSLSHLQTYVTELKLKLAEVGLALNVRKSLVLPPRGVTSGTIPAGITELAEAVPEGSAMGCLGVPVGDPTECEKRVEVTIGKIVGQVRGIARLENPIHVVQALRHAGGWSRAQHLFGSLAVAERHAAAVELADYEALRESLGSLGDGLDGLAWRQATLPAWLGGLGVVGVRDQNYGYHEHMDAVLRAVERKDPEVAKSLLAERRKSSDDQAKQRFRRLLEVSGREDRVRLRELAQGFGAPLAWLHRPVCAQMLPSPVVAAHLVSVILGMQLYPGRPEECPGSCRVRAGTGKRHVLDACGIHVHECTMTTIPRHNRLRDGLFRLLSQVIPASRVVVEASVTADGEVHTDRLAEERPVDLGVCPRGCWGWRCIDFRGISVREDLKDRAAGDGRVLAAAAEKAKTSDGRHRHWVGVMQAAGHQLVAGGFGPCGGLSKTLFGELRRIGRLADAEAMYADGGDLLPMITGAASFLVQVGSADAATRLRTALRLPPWSGSKASRWAESSREESLTHESRTVRWRIAELLKAAGSDAGAVTR